MMKNSCCMILVILISLFLNITLFSSFGTGDTEKWIETIKTIQQQETGRFFPRCINTQCDNFPVPAYPPFHYLIFFLFTRILPVEHIGYFFTVKIIIACFYSLSLLSVWYAYAAWKKQRNGSMSLLGLSTVFLSLVSLIINAQGLAYTDILYIPFLVCTIAALVQKKYLLSGIFYGTSFLFKWQPIIIAPVFFAYLLSFSSFNIPALFLLGILMPLTVLSFFDASLTYSSVQALNAAIHEPFLSAALNVPWITGAMISSVRPVPYIDIRTTPNFGIALLTAKGMFFATYALILWRYVKEKNKDITTFLSTALLVYASYFFLSSGVHENHFVFGTILSFLLFLYQGMKKTILLLIGTEAVNMINMTVFYGITGTAFLPRIIWGVDVTVVFALFLIWLYILFLTSFFQRDFIFSEKPRRRKNQL